MDNKQKILILSGLVLVSSFIFYKSLKHREKVNKQKKYSHWEAILVDSGIL